MVQRQVWYFLRISLMCLPVLSLVLVLAPLAFSATRFSRMQPKLVGPKTYYLALGDSLAFGYQPNLDAANGYANYFFSDLAKHGVKYYDNLACTGESSFTMINGGCPYALLRKYIYTDSQLQAAVAYLHKHAGQVSPVTLDIGANDLIPDLNITNCAINAKWQRDLVAVDTNLKNVILPQLIAAMTVKGQMTGDLLLLNYYDPYETACPKTVPNIQMLNQNLAADVDGRATLVDAFSAFMQPMKPASSPPVSNICAYTWMCGALKNIHPNKAGYAIMASAIEHTVNY